MIRNHLCYRYDVNFGPCRGSLNWVLPVKLQVRETYSLNKSELSGHLEDKINKGWRPMIDERPSCRRGSMVRSLRLVV